MLKPLNWTLTAVLVLSMAPDALAQSAAERGWVAGRVGANVQAAEDGENGTSIGGGGSAGFFVSRNWAVEFDAWVPAYIEDDGKRFRDVLFSGSAVRFFGDRVRPFLLVGLTIAQVQVDREFFGRTTNGYSYIQVGGGAMIPMGASRLHIVPEVRANIGITSNIVRPSIGIAYRF